MSSLLQAGINLTAVGMTVVFALLTLLVFIIRGMSALSRLLEVTPAENPGGGSTAPAPGLLSDHELVGVISAAIAAHRRRR